MDETKVTLTVLFEEPFWTGVVERVSKGRLSVTKITFGAEPKDYEVADFIREHYNQLQFSPTVEDVSKRTTSNPKRRQR